MQYLPSLESSLIQAIWWLTIFTNSYLLLKGLINKFCHKFANFDRLKGRQLWLNPRYHQSAHKDSLLQANQGNYQCPGPCKRHYQYSDNPSQPLRLNCHWLGVVFHFKVLIIAMLFLWHQIETFHCFLPIDKQSDQKAK